MGFCLQPDSSSQSGPKSIQAKPNCVICAPPGCLLIPCHREWPILRIPSWKSFENESYKSRIEIELYYFCSSEKPWPPISHSWIAKVVHDWGRTTASGLSFRSVSANSPFWYMPFYASLLQLYLVLQLSIASRIGRVFTLGLCFISSSILASGWRIVPISLQIYTTVSWMVFPLLAKVWFVLLIVTLLFRL